MLDMFKQKITIELDDVPKYMNKFNFMNSWIKRIYKY